MSSPLRVLVVSRTYHASGGGMEKLSRLIMDGLRQEPDLEIELVSYRGSRLLLPFFLLLALFPSASIVSSVDVIYLGDPFLSFVGWVLKKMYRKPVAVTVHGLDITYPNPLYQRYLRLFFQNFDAYIAISNHIQNELKKPNSHVIHPAIKDEWHNPSLTHTSATSPLPETLKDKIILLTAGRLIPRKGHAWFIQNVLPHLPEKFVYVIAGEGSSRAKIETTIKATKTGQRVALLGRVTDEQLKTLYNTSDAFIQPNINLPGDVEGFGLVLLEAASCNLPIFAANTQGIRDVITHEKNGYLLPAENTDAWISAIANSFANQKQLQARQFTLSHFSVSGMIQKYKTLFKQLAAHR